MEFLTIKPMYTVKFYSDGLLHKLHDLTLKQVEELKTILYYSYPNTNCYWIKQGSFSSFKTIERFKIAGKVLSRFDQPDICESCGQQLTKHGISITARLNHQCTTA